MTESINLNVIDSAVRAAARMADRVSYEARPNSDAYQQAKHDTHTAREAEKELAKLSRVWPRIQALLASADREYDRFVTRGRDYEDDERTGCSCHLSAPCSFCTRDADTDDESEALATGAGQ